MQFARKVSVTYRDADDKSSRYGLHLYPPETPADKAGAGSVSGEEASGGSGLSAQLSDFQPKAVITVRNSQMTSHVMFHPFKDIIAISDGLGVDMWYEIKSN